jgi:anti-sigma regulatory factor (Ser/Thr protein kinase)
MRATLLCDDESRSRVMLGLVEMFTNAVEHGNLGVSGAEKQALKAQGEIAFQQELRRRMNQPPYRERKVYVTASVNEDAAVFTIRDEGQGFDFSNLPDPTDADNLFKSSGRGILLTRAFVDELSYSGCGNRVTLVKRRDPRRPS